MGSESLWRKILVQFRIIENVSEQDVEEIHRELKKYNHSKREKSESIARKRTAQGA
jgi:hypothetical protein